LLKGARQIPVWSVDSATYYQDLAIPGERELGEYLCRRRVYSGVY